MIKSDLYPSRRLEVSDLACMRGERDIFSSVGFSVGPGELLLLRGPNGAGKTSLLMCLCGFVPTIHGTIDWQGCSLDEEPGTDTHFVGHLSAVKPGLTVEENLKFWALVNGGDVDGVDQAIEVAGLGHAGMLDAGLLSAGQTRRLALSRLGVAPRPIWLLDEPTAALDAAGDKWVGGLIDTHLDRGGMVIAATHLDVPVKDQARVKTVAIGRVA